MAKITLDNLRHSYTPNPQRPEDWALKEMSQELKDGGAYALLGPSGCGKTTLLNLISGLLRPTQGRILFDDTDVSEMTPEQRNIAQVFQFPVIYDTMTVYDNLAFPLRNRGVPAAEVDRRVKEVGEMLDLGHMLTKRASGLTADGKQKISLGRGLVRSDVNVIMFDEPLTVIDPHLKWRLRSKLKELHQRIGKTVVYVTHDQTEAMTFADRVVVMNNGEVVQVGTPIDLFERPTHTFVGHFIGSPGMNVLPCRVEGRVAYVDGQAIALAQAYPALPPDRRVELGIRPEFVRLDTGGGGLPVRVRRIDDIGRSRIARVEMGGRPMSASVPETLSVVGEDASLVMDPRHVHIYADGHLVAGERAP